MSRLSNREYYESRVATERALAAEAGDATIAALHAELANRYAALLADLDQPAERTKLRVANN